MSEAVITIAGLSVRYGTTTVLDRFDLTVAAGAVVCLVGENGVGKSTLLRCVTGLQEPDEGTVRVFGAAPDGSAAYWRRVAATVEEPSWYAGLTVREHLELVRLATGADPADGRIDLLLTEFGLTGVGDSTPDTLSSGQRQRFLLGAVLARPSRLLVLDEPEQRLDTTVKRVVAGQLHGYVEAGGTVLLASHDPAFVAELGGEVRLLTSAGPPAAEVGAAG
jgi:ABC-2 type transport system ATP-binding protein